MVRAGGPRTAMARLPDIGSLTDCSCTCTRRRPRRLGGGKGGESRAPRDPKNPAKKVLRRMIEKAIAR